MPILQKKTQTDTVTITSLKVGDDVFCPNEYGAEVLTVTKLNPFDPAWLWAKADFWVKADYFHVFYLKLID
jgi:hypothetical protein